MLIQNFSTGYRANGLALQAAPAQLREAQGLVPNKRPLLVCNDKNEEDAVITKEEETSNPPVAKKIRSQDVLAPKAVPRLSPNKEITIPTSTVTSDEADGSKPLAIKATRRSARIRKPRQGNCESS